MNDGIKTLGAIGVIVTGAILIQKARKVFINPDLLSQLGIVGGKINIEIVDDVNIRVRSGNLIELSKISKLIIDGKITSVEIFTFKDQEEKVSLVNSARDNLERAGANVRVNSILRAIASLGVDSVDELLENISSVGNDDGVIITINGSSLFVPVIDGNNVIDMLIDDFALSRLLKNSGISSIFLHIDKRADFEFSKQVEKFINEEKQVETILETKIVG